MGELVSPFMFLDRKVSMRIKNIAIENYSEFKVIDQYDENDWKELFTFEYWNNSIHEGI
jgi:hypothetical protein